METEQINWANDFEISDFLSEKAAELIGIFSRLKSNNKNHPSVNDWDKEGKKWGDYRQNLLEGKLFFATEESANAEIERLQIILEEAQSIEDNLLKSKNV